tara:strand:- start:17486 stop:17797 length:312 start_codon:yes stop_codon:yes gene_type:complete
MDIAFGRQSGGREAQKASPPKEKKAGQFQVMRARARAGSLVKADNKRDSLLGGDTVRTNVKPKTVKVLESEATKHAINSARSSNDPYRRDKERTLKPGAGYVG